MKKAVPRDRRADRAFVDQLAAGLVRAAEERVGRAADAQAALLAPPAMSLRASATVDAERLFGMHVLAGCERLKADLDMGRRHGEVDDDLDRRVGQQFVDAPCRDAELAARASAASWRMSATPLTSRIGKC